MDLPDIFAATLGLSAPWKIADVSFVPDEKRVDITVTYATPDAEGCPYCGSTDGTCKAVKETWYHDDFFSYSAYLHAELPCHLSCKHATVDRPWSRSGSRFTLYSSESNDRVE